MKRLFVQIFMVLLASCLAMATNFTSTTPNGIQNLYPSNGSVSLTGGSMPLDGTHTDGYVSQEVSGTLFTISLTQSAGPLEISVLDPGGTVIGSASSALSGTDTFSLLNIPASTTGYYLLDITSICGAGCTGSASYSFTIDPTSNTSSVPEPASLLLISTGLAGFAGVIRRRLFR